MKIPGRNLAMERPDHISAALGALILICLSACRPVHSVPKEAVALPPDSPPALVLELTAYPLTVTFRNEGTEPLRILRPLDGSEERWILPPHKLSVLDERGNEARGRPGCGDFFGKTYSRATCPSRYLITIPPAGVYRHSLSHAFARKATLPFRYTVQFQYLFRPDTDQTPRSVNAPALWRGEATSNQIEINLVPTQVNVAPSPLIVPLPHLKEAQPPLSVPIPEGNAFSFP